MNIGVVTALSFALASTTPAPGSADAALRPLPYAELARKMTAKVTFDGILRRDEPGFSFDHPFPVEGVSVGPWIAGLTPGVRVGRDGARHDDLGGDTPALAPLRLVSAPSGQGLAVAHHRGFGSNAVFPLGPKGFSDIGGRGEGALAVLYPVPQAGIGLRVHGDYADPLGSRGVAPGAVRIVVLAGDGTMIGSHALRLGTGITEIAVERPDGQPDIAGFLLLNDDPGGIAVDDILVAPLIISLRRRPPLDPLARASQDGPTPG